MSTDLNLLNCSVRNRPHIGIIGAGKCDAELELLAEEVGTRIGQKEAVLICGGMGGVMTAACRGAKSAGGLTIGILPGDSRTQANPYIDIAIATGMGEARNLTIIRTADVLIAIGGSYGTLSEIGFALKMGKRVIGLKTWDIPGIVPAESVEQALKLIE